MQVYKRVTTIVIKQIDIQLNKIEETLETQPDKDLTRNRTDSNTSEQNGESIATNSYHEKKEVTELKY